MKLDTYKTHMVSSGAVWSPDMLYRYLLVRRWNLCPSYMPSMLCVIGLNPSTASNFHNDPTVARCCELAYRQGYDGINLVNIFAIRATDPKLLYEVNNDIVGPDNDYWIRAAIELSSDVLCCWGNHGKHLNRSDDVRKLLRGLIDVQWCINTTKTGEPIHPLYQRYSKLKQYTFGVNNET